MIIFCDFILEIAFQLDNILKLNLIIFSKIVENNLIESI